MTLDLPQSIARHCHEKSLSADGAVCLEYDDGLVSASMQASIHASGARHLVIGEWLSHKPGLGHAGRLLRHLRQHFDLISADGIGEIDRDGPDISVEYWRRQHQKGLVDRLVLDDGTVLDMGLASPAPASRDHPGSGKAKPSRGPR